MTSKKAPKKTIAGLTAELAEANRQIDGWRVKWLEEAQKTGEILMLRLDNVKLKHQLEVLKLISENKPLEAMQSFLRADKCLIGLDVQVPETDESKKRRQVWTAETNGKNIVATYHGHEEKK